MKMPEDYTGPGRRIWIRAITNDNGRTDLVSIDGETWFQWRPAKEKLGDVIDMVYSPDNGRAPWQQLEGSDG